MSLSGVRLIAKLTPQGPAQTQTQPTPDGPKAVALAKAPIDEIATPPARYATAAPSDGWTTTTLVRAPGNRGRGGGMAFGGKMKAEKELSDGADGGAVADPAEATAERKLAMLGERRRAADRDKAAGGEPAPELRREAGDDARSAEVEELKKVMDAPASKPAAGLAAPKKSARRSSSKGPGGTNFAAMPKLKAGAVDDNERWDEYLTFQQDNANLIPESYRLDITERYIVEVTDKAGRPLPNARVGVAGDDKLLLEGRTVSSGRVLFFPRTVQESEGVASFDVTVQYGGETIVKSFPRKKHGADAPWQIQLDVEKQQEKVQLDLLFCLDTTGSMGDEIRRVQATLLQITKQIRALESKPTVRYGMVLYRDRTDDYITRRFGFTSDVEAFDKALKQVAANGGGDAPEAMNMGLFAAVDQMPWAEDALRLVFLVADAPPHMDYADDVPYVKTLKSAVAKGIKIFPTAASGLDPQGTYVMRQIGQMTHARFLYIEYGAKGATAARHGVERPTTPKGSNNLDDIIVRIVRDELAEYTR